MARDAGPRQRALGRNGMRAVEGSLQRRQARARMDGCAPRAAEGAGSTTVERALSIMQLTLS